MLINFTFRNCLLFLVTLSSVPVFSAPQPRGTLPSSTTKIGSEVWIEQKVRQYPELLWLVEPSSTGASLKSPSGAIFSPTLFQKKVPAFDIAVRSLIHLHLLIQGSRQAYAQLIQLQTSESPLTFKQFLALHKQLTLFLNSPKEFYDSVKVLETAIVLRHLGCSTKAVAAFKPYFSEMQREAFYTKALHVLHTFPELSPSFARLSPEQKTLFFSLRKLANYDELLSLTNTPSFQLLSAGRSQRALLALDLYLYALDSCGEQGMSSQFHTNFAPLQSMLQQYATVEEAFSRYFTYRANRLGFDGSSRSEMALVRMATLMNLSPSEAAILTTSFKTLPTEEADTLINSFYTNKGDSLALSLRGLPTLVSELTRTAHGNTNAEARSQQIYATTLSLVVKSLKAHKEMLNKQILSKEIVLDFSETAASCQGLDIFSENVAVQIHLNGTVSIHL
ncbi:hypothetical protein FTN73_00555 [Chlamydia trachomatis]|uniref:Uncharacterized protein n=1 Tax=Chlamydia trachomatis serovar D (strain ATCC VR-885 / DSM 19411 / UW-3/Cx) TaxID=272561 RepID=O84738_CHLTR|nr:hypothetical protein [Chlamydia trachomatis]NP_220252.1 hypothetical protein CT_733 [Chlamydia trachomatis D/UW-3/CX]AAC68328.1 hypothetical protein CT_733 [Chlamydia trachomatis D/UW-3/CX]ADI51410.1 Hypothetical membrane associated protein [Chlamydia trachomatis D-EC]ADI52422.1 Hypothetical membrane associated protein [Chlamydia trachomatis D-LC]AEJ77368.1 hypothetical protein CTL2C_449 [Chlamydia trachomatis L2c]AGT70263.1 membrane protein [Chlamydia trachomatis]